MRFSNYLRHLKTNKYDLGGNKMNIALMILMIAIALTLYSLPLDSNDNNRK